MAAMADFIKVQAIYSRKKASFAAVVPGLEETRVAVCPVCDGSRKQLAQLWRNGQLVWGWVDTCSACCGFGGHRSWKYGTAEKSLHKMTG